MDRDWITGVIERLGYTGIAALTFLENVFPPIPSEVVIPLAGFVSARGILRLDIVIVAATVGSLAGSTAWYALGRRVGEARLQANFERVRDYINVVSNIVLALFVALVVFRYVRCWREGASQPT